MQTTVDIPIAVTEPEVKVLREGRSVEVLILRGVETELRLNSNVSGGTWKEEEVKAVAEAFEASKKCSLLWRNAQIQKGRDCSRPFCRTAINVEVYASLST